MRAVNERSSYSSEQFTHRLDIATSVKSLFFESSFTNHASDEFIHSQLQELVSKVPHGSVLNVLEIGTSWFINFLPQHRQILSDYTLSITAVNVSPEEIEKHKSLLTSSSFYQVFSDASVVFQAQDAEKLNFADGQSFHLVIGGAILHHLAYSKLLQSLQKFLSTSSLQIYREPVDSNPILNLYRNLTPFLHTEDETPISISSFDRISRSIGYSPYYFYQESTILFFFLLVFAFKVLRLNRYLLNLANLDGFISNLPFFRRFSRIVTIFILSNGY